MGLLDALFKPKPAGIDTVGAAVGKGAFLVSDVFSLSGLGVYLYGKVVSGVIEKDLSATVDNNKGEIALIERESGEVALASEGDIVALKLKAGKKDWFKIGQLLVFR